jgi:HEAT repeat protein
MVAAVASFALRQREPMYEGRPVIAWIKEGYCVPQGKKPQKANEAVIAVGTNALTYYLDLLKSRDDSRLKARICDVFKKQHWLKLGFVDTWPYSYSLRRCYGSCGLMILGADAKGAIPDLTRLLDDGDEDQIGRAATTLSYVGLEGIQPLTNLLANHQARGRGTAVIALGRYAERETDETIQRKPRAPEEIDSNSRIIVPVLIPYLKDSDPRVRLSVVEALGEFAREPDIVVPAISEILEKNKGGNRAFEDISMSALAAFGPEAKSALPLLGELLKDPDPIISHRAADSIKVIGSEAAAGTSPK